MRTQYMYHIISAKPLQLTFLSRSVIVVYSNVFVLRAKTNIILS